MIKVSKATWEDVLEAYAQRKEVFNGEHDILEGAENCLARGRLYAFTDAYGRLCGVFGFILIWRGVASVSAITTEHLDANPVGVVRALKQLIAHYVKELTLHRCEMYVKKDYHAGDRFAQTLGFTAEGVARKFGPDQSDYTMYGRV